MITRRHAIHAAALAVAAALSVPQAARAADGPVRIGYLKHGPGAAIHVLGQYGPKHGVTIEPVEFKRYADTRTAVASGSIEMGLVGPQDVPLVVSQGEQNLIVVMGLAIGGDVMVVRKGVPVRTFADYAGKRVSVGKGGVAWLKLVASLEDQSLDYGTVRSLNVVGGGDEHVKLMRRGDIDAMAIWEPFGAIAVAEGIGEYAPTDIGRSRAVGALNGLVVANRRFLEQKPEAVKKTMAALMESAQTLEKDRDRWVSVIRQYIDLDPAVVKQSIAGIHYDFGIPQTTIEELARFLAKVGLVQKDVSGELFARFYTYRLLEQVAGKPARELGAR